MRSIFGLGIAITAVFSAVGCSSSDEGAKTAPASQTATNPAPPAATNNVPAPAATTPAPTNNSSVFVQTACRFIIPKSVEGTAVTCFDLTVPENRRNDDPTKTIKLHVARVKGGNPNGVPTIELIGGPGGGSDDIVGSLVAGRKELTDAYGPILKNGDLVLFDQRGVGRSLPRLSCDESSADDPTPGCKAALEAKGIDLAAYDTIENADDVHDLKVALGVPLVDIHGISYGTRLGLEILKRHGDDIRAAIVDGVMPPDVPIMGQFPVAMNTIFSTVFAACEADATCNTTYPNLEDTVNQLKAKLTATPFSAKDPDTLERYQFDWDAFMSDLIEQSYDEGTAAKIPWMLHSLLSFTQQQFDAQSQKDADAQNAEWDAEEAAEANNPLIQELNKAEMAMTDEDVAALDIADGMYLSVTCNDYAQHETVAADEAITAGIRTALQDNAELEGEFADCAIWPTRASLPTVQAPATYAGPVLVIGGDVDPATPVAWAKHVASSLPNHQFVEVPTGGHGQMDTCGAGLKGTFFGDPTKALDGSCATTRKFAFFYDAPTTGAHAAFRGISGLLAAKAPASSLTQRTLARALVASKVPGVTPVLTRVARMSGAH